MKTLFYLALFSFIVLRLPAQDIEQMLSKYTQENGKKYLQPLADCMGANFNSGLIHSARIKKSGFQIYLGLVTTTAFVPDKRKTFEGTPEGFFEPKNPVEVPTLFGPSKNVVVNGDGGTQYVFPGGLNLKLLPMAMPQLSIGSVFGTDLTLRYFAYNINDEIGKINLFGLGLRHSISQYVPGLPVDLAAGIYNQYFSIGDFVSAKNWLFNIQSSYSIIIFTFYGALGYEASTLDIEYTYSDDGENITQKFDLKGTNSVRLTAGVTFNLGPVKLNVDYNLASQSVLAVGLGVGIGDK
jgi:hypothetical protein